MAESLEIYSECATVPDWNNPGFFGDFTSECYDSEKAILDSLIAENENINGITCVYYRMSLDAKQDELLGDDPTRHAIDSFRFMATAPEAAAVKHKMNGISVFGYDSDSFDIEAGIAHFIASQKNHLMPPMVGDIVRILNNSAFFSIIYVDNQSEKTQPYHAQTVFKIKLKMWENNHHGVEFGDDIAEHSDDPMGDLKALQDEADKGSLFKADDQLEKLREEDSVFYKPSDIELPPNNDKNNPFPMW